MDCSVKLPEAIKKHAPDTSEACFCSGPEGDRTLDLRVANAALSQLSYEPIDT